MGGALGVLWGPCSTLCSACFGAQQLARSWEYRDGHLERCWVGRGVVLLEKLWMAALARVLVGLSGKQLVQHMPYWHGVLVPA